MAFMSYQNEKKGVIINEINYRYVPSVSGDNG